MSIKAFIEAGKKATAGPWHWRKGAASFHVWNHGNASDLATSGHICGMSDDHMPYEQREANAEFIASARNAAKEIEELRDWARRVTAEGENGQPRLVWHFGGCHAPFGEPCTCKTDRIRELVK